MDEFEKLCVEAESWSISPIEDCFIELDRKKQTVKYLCRYKSVYLSGSDPLALMEAVKLSLDGGFSFPVWAHKALSEAFTLFMDGRGDVSLESILNIKKERGAGSGPFKKLENTSFKASVVSMVVFLNKVVGFTLPVCYSIVSELKIPYGIDVVPKEKEISYGRIEKIYKSCSSKQKTIAISLPEQALAGHGPLYVFKEKFENVFFQLCESGEIGAEESVKAMKTYRKFIQRFEN